MNHLWIIYMLASFGVGWILDKTINGIWEIKQAKKIKKEKKDAEICRKEH